MNDVPARSLTAEAIGTFALCFAGILAINVNQGDGSLIGVAFAHGLTIAVMVAALGAISGGHFNPAVTAGFVVTGRMSVARGAMYAVAQLLGAVLAALLIELIFVGDEVARGTPALGEGVASGTGTVLEAVTTFFLVLVIFGTAVDDRAPKSVFPLAIGLTIVLDILAIGPLTGAAMNPARAFGPALVSGAWDSHWIYWVGPIVGGALAAVLQHRFLMHASPSPAVAARGGPSPSEERGNP